MEVVDRGRHQANIVFDAFKFIEGALKELNVACCAAVPYHPTTSSGASNVSSFHNFQCLIDVNKVT